MPTEMGTPIRALVSGGARRGKKVHDAMRGFSRSLSRFVEGSGGQDVTLPGLLDPYLNLGPN